MVHKQGVQTNPQGHEGRPQEVHQVGSSVTRQGGRTRVGVQDTNWHQATSKEPLPQHRHGPRRTGAPLRGADRSTPQQHQPRQPGHVHRTDLHTIHHPLLQNGSHDWEGGCRLRTRECQRKRGRCRARTPASSRDVPTAAAGTIPQTTTTTTAANGQQHRRGHPASVFARPGSIQQGQARNHSSTHHADPLITIWSRQHPFPDQELRLCCSMNTW
mmetsp:Transcript_23100/g.64466  ORF Transcript_23100/g.64466 Transcript_23100/m.64466 type:complete len:215 (+) Transcript_23100:302-946(+)